MTTEAYRPFTSVSTRKEPIPPRTLPPGTRWIQGFIPGATPWTVRPYNNTETPENYVISLAAVDTAGNATGYLGLPENRNVVDQSSDRPVISFNDIDKDETDAANNVLVGANTLSGVIEDDDSIDPALFSGDSIEISIDGGNLGSCIQSPFSQVRHSCCLAS